MTTLPQTTGVFNPDPFDFLPEPDAIHQRRCWTILCDRVPELRRYRTDRRLEVEPADADPLAWLYWRLCDPRVKDVMKMIMSGEIDDLAAEKGQVR